MLAGTQILWSVLDAFGQNVLVIKRSDKLVHYYKLDREEQSRGVDLCVLCSRIASHETLISLTELLVTGIMSNAGATFEKECVCISVEMLIGGTLMALNFCQIFYRSRAVLGDPRTEICCTISVEKLH